MNKVIRAIALVSCGTIPVSIEAKDDNNFTITVKEPVYTLDTRELFIKIIENSYQVNIHKSNIDSELNLYRAASYYYIPSATVSSEVRRKMTRPGHPLPFSDFTLELAAQMKLWSNATSDQKKAAYCNLKAAKERYNDAVNSAYSVVQTNLIKIELARKFIRRSEEYHKRLDILLKKIEGLTQSGVLKKSDKLFAKVAVKKFEESILNVKSQVEQFKSQINNLTPINLYKDEYGVSSGYINASISIEGTYFDMNNVLNKNFGILTKKAELYSALKSAEGYNENFTVEIVTRHGIKEHKYTSIKNAENQAVYGYTYDDDGQGYIGVKFSYTGMNYQNHKRKQSQYNLYTKKMIEFDDYVHQIYVELNSYKQQYELVNSRISNINKQISLTSDATTSMVKELAVDESSAYDIFRNLTSLADLEMNFLTLQYELVDLVLKVKSLNSIIPDNYVIN